MLAGIKSGWGAETGIIHFCLFTVKELIASVYPYINKNIAKSFSNSRGKTLTTGKVWRLLSPIF